MPILPNTCWNRSGTPRTATDQRRRNPAPGDPGDPGRSGGGAQALRFLRPRGADAAAIHTLGAGGMEFGAVPSPPIPFPLSPALCFAWAPEGGLREVQPCSTPPGFGLQRARVGDDSERVPGTSHRRVALHCTMPLHCHALRCTALH
eukprot:gene9253-biopygen18205